MRFVLAAALLLFAGGVFALAQERARVELDEQQGKIVIEADRLFQESGTLWRAEGNVIVTHRDMTLTAPRILYNAATGVATADATVEITRGLQWLKGSRAEFNLEANTGTIYDAEGFTAEELYVRARKLIKTGPDQYRAEDGFLTACEESLPKWSFTIDKAQIQQGGNARFTHTFFKIKSVPIFYLPFMIFPTGEKERSSGFMIPTTGNSNVRGRRVSQSFYLVLGRSADIMFHEDYFSKRGFGHGLNFRTRPHAATSLDADWYFVDDRKDQGGTLFRGFGQTRLPHGFRAAAHFNLVSSFVFRQVFSDDFYTATQPTENSRVFVSNNYQSRSFNFLISREETIFPDRNAIIRSAPSVSFRLTGQKLFNTPLYLDLDSSAGGMSRSDRLFETPGVTQRLDLFPRVYFSIPLFQGLRLTPRLGFRQTFYSDSLATEDTETERIDTEGRVLTGDNIDRRYFEFTADLSGWGLSNIYSDSSGEGWKHLIEPTLRYRYVNGIDEFDRIIRFDEEDAIVNTNEVEYALFNRFFIKRNTQDGPMTHEWLSLKIGQKYFLDPDFGGSFSIGSVNQFFPLYTLTGFPYGGTRRQVSPLTALLRFTPQPGYGLDVRGDYDPKFDTFRNFSVTGFLGRPGLILGTTYFVTRALEEGTFQSHQLQGQIAVGNLGRGLSASTVFSYDAETRRLLTHRSRLNYYWDCCGISVEFQGFDIGIRQEQQLRFSIFLKGIGTFGTIDRPDSIF